jgi:hypothetical protein
VSPLTWAGQHPVLLVTLLVIAMLFGAFAFAAMAEAVARLEAGAE